MSPHDNRVTDARHCRVLGPHKRLDVTQHTSVSGTGAGGDGITQEIRWHSGKGLGLDTVMRVGPWDETGLSKKQKGHQTSILGL